jgi:hypothetical protein
VFDGERRLPLVQDPNQDSTRTIKLELEGMFSGQQAAF